MGCLASWPPYRSSRPLRWTRPPTPARRMTAGRRSTRQPVAEVRRDLGDVHLRLLQPPGIVPVHRLPAGELVEHPDAGLPAAVPGQPVPPERQMRFSSRRGVIDAHHPSADALPEPERIMRVVGIDGRRQAITRRVRQRYRLVEAGVGGHPHDGPEGLLAEQCIPRPLDPSTLWCGWIQPRYSSNRVANFWSSIGP